MIKHRESLISAFHNYLVNDMLSPGFFVGDPHSEYDFYLLADIMLPEEVVPPISARLFDRQGVLLLELKRNSPAENPGHCTIETTPGGFRIVCSSGEVLFEVNTQRFANGYLTRIKAQLYDRGNILRIEPLHEGVQVYGQACLALEAPFEFHKR
ncbi:MAG: hypothetical protein JRJ79_10025 [Deltaproteobacteria bacterium]|nr:hypothetical protein [Deltaproteobacteria bacterium]